MSKIGTTQRENNNLRKVYIVSVSVPPFLWSMFEPSIMTCLVYYLGTVFVKQCLEAVPVGYGSNNNDNKELMIRIRLMIRKRMERMICHFDHISEATTCNYQFSESEWWGFFIKRIWMYHFGKFTSFWNCVCHQYCTVPPVLCCIILHCNTSIVLTCAVSLKYFVH